MTAPRTRNSRGAGSRLRDEIIDSGIALIDQTNDAASLTLRGVARAAGVSAPSIYPHFADVQAVTDAVLDRSFTQLETQVAAAVAGKPVASDALIAAAHSYVEFGWEHRARYRLMFAGTGFAPNAVNTFTLFETTLTRCVKSGDSVSADPHQDTFLVWVALHGIATLEKPQRNDYLRLGPLDRPASVTTLVHRLAQLTDQSRQSR